MSLELLEKVSKEISLLVTDTLIDVADDGTSRGIPPKVMGSVIVVSSLGAMLAVAEHLGISSGEVVTMLRSVADIKDAEVKP